jgi:hypothetical protein
MQPAGGDTRMASVMIQKQNAQAGAAASSKPAAGPQGYSITHAAFACIVTPILRMLNALN